MKWAARVLSAAVVLAMTGVPMLLGDEPKEVNLKPGDKAPAFRATDDQNKTWDSKDHYGKKIVVVYFFPAAMTGG